MFTHRVPSVRNFNPRPPRGGRRHGHGRPVFCDLISIHALREEGDRLSAIRVRLTLMISIHALREEGDLPGLSTFWK